MYFLFEFNKSEKLKFLLVIEIFAGKNNRFALQSILLSL